MKNWKIGCTYGGRDRTTKDLKTVEVEDTLIGLVTSKNAALIATAPEMLAMLERLWNLHPDGEWHDEVDALIKKAKGLT